MVHTEAMVRQKGMYWGNLLHFYQPHGQKREIIDAIVAQCYRPIAESVLASPRARLTVNFTGVLLGQLAAFGHQNVIDMYAEAAKRGQIEFVGSAKYHAILPLLSKSEAARQIELHNESNRRYLGDNYKPRGIFLPEMAWTPELAGLLADSGFEWVMLDELAYNGHTHAVDYSKTYRVAGTNLMAMFREHRLSATIMNAAPRDLARLKETARNELSGDRYVVTGMDGETFGHHRVGHDRLLAAMFEDPEINLVRISDILDRFTNSVECKTVACTWASSEDDIAKGVQFISWDDPSNQIHALQWELLRLTVSSMEQLPINDPHYARLRSQLDPAMASDQFFWASGKPWWMIEHIERGAHDLLEVLQRLPNVSQQVAQRGQGLYQEIMALAWEWQRSGRIDSGRSKQRELVRIPFREATLDKDDAATWQAFMELLKNEERNAASHGEYEEAILWRDAIYKLEHKLDVYDLHYVLDILGRKLPRGVIEDTVARHKKEFDRIRGGQVEQRSN